MSVFDEYNFRYTIYHKDENAACFVARWYSYFRYYENITNSSKNRIMKLSEKPIHKDFDVNITEEDICIYSYRQTK